MSSRVSPASATASRQASTVRSISERPRRRPTADWPIPEMIGPAFESLVGAPDAAALDVPSPALAPVRPRRR